MRGITMTTALTYPERLIRDGEFGEGLNLGASLDIDALRPRLRAARDAWKTYRAAHGFKPDAAAMLTPPDAQPKLGKSETPAYGLMLVPAAGLPAEFWPGSRPVNVCPRASAGCAAACLAYAGKGAMSTVQRARAVRTGFLLAHPFHAGILIGHEAAKAVEKHGDIALRLNVLSDIRWESVAYGGLMALRGLGVRLYDYTAWMPQQRHQGALSMLDYSLTYSAKEPAHTPDDYLTGVLSSGGTVAMPFTTRKGQPLPESWQGFRVIDGDLSDARYEDPAGVVVGLRQKGRAVDETGFIRQA